MSNDCCDTIDIAPILHHALQLSGLYWNDKIFYKKNDAQNSWVNALLIILKISKIKMVCSNKKLLF